MPGGDLPALEHVLNQGDLVHGHREGRSDADIVHRRLVVGEAVVVRAGNGEVVELSAQNRIGLHAVNFGGWHTGGVKLVILVEGKRGG